MKRLELAAYQQDLKESLQADADAEHTVLRYIEAGQTADEAGERLAIYRNNVVYALTQALGALYPVVKRLIGDACFLGAAKQYARLHPSTEPDVTFYGRDFATFIATFEPCRQLEYLPEVARLEWHCHRAFHAADASALEPQQLAAMAPSSFESMSFNLHPSAALMDVCWPVDAIWAENLKDEVEDVMVEKGAYHLLVYRRNMQVQVVTLQPAPFRLLQHLASGTVIALAWQALAEAKLVQHDEFPGLVGYLLGLGVFSGVEMQPP